MTFSTADIARALGIRTDATVPQLTTANAVKLSEYERRDNVLEQHQRVLAQKIKYIPANGSRKKERQRHTDKFKQLQTQRDALSNIISALQSYQHALEMLQITKDGVSAMKASTSVLAQVTIPDIKEVEIMTEESNETMDKIKEVSDQLSATFNMDCSMPIDATDDAELEAYLEDNGFGDEQMLEPVASIIAPAAIGPIQVQPPRLRFQSLTEEQLSAKLPSAPNVAPEATSATAAPSSSMHPLRMTMRAQS